MDRDRSKAKILLIATLMLYLATVVIGRLLTGHWSFGLLGLLLPVI